MRTQLWHPDTCDCLIEETCNEDNEVTEGKAMRKCDVHKDVPDGELYGVLFSNPDGENKRKNEVQAILLGHRSLKGLDLTETKIDKNDQEVIVFKKGTKYNWHFLGTGKDRVLHFSLDGSDINAADRKRIKDECELKFGKNKVVHL